MLHNRLLRLRRNETLERNMPRTARHSGLTSIVAVGLRGEIGVRNELPWRLKSDLRFFKRTTLHNLVIMGRKTFQSIGGCLPSRENIVLSHRPTLFEDHAGCHHSHSVGETLHLREKCAAEAFVIGGALTYQEFAPFVDRYIVTVVRSAFPAADAFFSEQVIGNEDNWVQRELEVERLGGDADEYDFSVLELVHRRPSEITAARDAEMERFRERNHLLKRKIVRRRGSVETLVLQDALAI